MSSIQTVETKPVKATGKVEVITYKAGTKKEIKPRIVTENLVVDNDGSGLQMLLDKITGESANPVLSYIRLGTGTSSPTDSDSSLETPETNGGTDDDGYHDITFIQDNGNQRILEIFMSDQSLPDGTYEEIGLFFQKGEMYARALFTNSGSSFQKSSGEDKQINYQINFSN